MGAEVPAFGVGLVGCGTVGGAVATLLTKDGAALRSRIGRRIELRGVVDVDFANAERLGLDPSLFRSDLDQLLADDGVAAVVELVGGTTVAKQIIEQALRANKHVVTANKALLAHHGAELYALARENGVCVAFEAACAGGIPIIRALCDGLIANRLDALYGIVNGTCNYILTAMTRKGQSYADALAQAQRDGLAEADPTLDVAGIDSAHKLAILAALAFGQKVDFHAIPVEGIDSLELCDVQYGQELGYVIKLLAIAQRRPDGLALRVRPAFIHTDHPLAWVSGPFNAISVYGSAVGHTMYYGRGAGGMPTASAVVADLAAVALGTAPQLFAQLPIFPDRTAAANQLPIEAVESRYYLRVVAEDKPGVLGQITAILGREGISISSVLQHEPPAGSDPGAGVPVVITTARAVEGSVRKAIAEVDNLPAIKAQSTCIGIVDEHEEKI
ncbi:MAG TPA: homoserine dehydrogenase [Phycisphaerae bacterium]|nr:homoserine dehydrogenase [Phycisphaerae bacterium]